MMKTSDLQIVITCHKQHIKDVSNCVDNAISLLPGSKIVVVFDNVTPINVNADAILYGKWNCPSCSRNHGAEINLSKFVCWIDADDLLLSGVDSLLKYLPDLANKKISAISTGEQIYSHNQLLSVASMESYAKSIDQITDVTMIRPPRLSIVTRDTLSVVKWSCLPCQPWTSSEGILRAPIGGEDCLHWKQLINLGPAIVEGNYYRYNYRPRYLDDIENAHWWVPDANRLRQIFNIEDT